MNQQKLMKSALERKPPHGAPCNRCGYCCKAIICPFGAVLFKRQHGPCPALVENEAGLACGVVAHPMNYARVRTLTHGVEEMRRAALLLIGAGDGCDAVANGEPANEAFRQKLVEVHESDARRFETGAEAVGSGVRRRPWRAATGTGHSGLRAGHSGLRVIPGFRSSELQSFRSMPVDADPDFAVF